MANLVGMTTHQRVQLAGRWYVILEECEFERLRGQSGTDALTSLGDDKATLAERVIARRKVAGLSQAALARNAGIRVETLNRIERGKTTSPDFATMRKLVGALQEIRDAR